MRKAPLSPGEIGRARVWFSLFAILNVISFTLLSGNIITLYALRLGAGNFLIGLLSSFMYSAYLCMLIGRLIAPHWGMTRLMGRFWIVRYLLMLPLLFAPFLAARGHRDLAFGLMIFSVLGFNAARGIAITGYNPILGEIATEKDRGAFLARTQASQQLVTLGLGIGMALLLGRNAPLSIYNVFIVLGIATGVWGASIIFRLPEPAHHRKAPGENIWRGLGEAFRQRTFRKFIIIYFLSSLAIYMVTPFLVVYIKKVYDQPDNQILYFTVFGSLGAVLMALASGFMIDRLGAKPLYFIFSGILTLILVPIAVSPRIASPAGVWAFAAALFFFNSMGQNGILNAGQTYFFAAIKPEERLNLGVIYFMTLGLAGGTGSLLGGAVLEWLGALLPQSETLVFQIYFAFCAAGFLAILFFINSMENLGAYPILDALGAIFSPRDLRAISLLNRLSRTRSLAEEKDTIRALAEAQSELSVQDVLSRLRSPRFSIRAEALQALSSLPVDEAVVQALISEVRNHAYTTAYLAADILGSRRIAQGIPALRKSLHSRDFFLSGKSMVALAQLGDRESIPIIKEILSKTSNPRLIIHGATALGIHRDPTSLAILLEKLKGKTLPYLRDEIIMAISGILGFEGWFYPNYVDFLEKGTTGLSLLRDFVQSGEALLIPRELLEELLDRLPHGNKRYFTSFAVELLTALSINVGGEDVAPLLAQAAADPQLERLERFAFLVASAIVWYARGRQSQP